MRRVAVTLGALAMLLVPVGGFAFPDGCTAVGDVYMSGPVTSDQSASMGIHGYGAWRVIRERPVVGGQSEFTVFRGEANQGLVILEDVLQVGDYLHCRSYGGAVVAGRFAG